MIITVAPSFATRSSLLAASPLVEEGDSALPLVEDAPEFAKEGFEGVSAVSVLDDEENLAKTCICR